MEQKSSVKLYSTKCGKLIPRRGTASELAGIDSPIMLRNTMSENRTVTPSGNFSPDSGGKVNPKIARKPIRPHGMRRLKK